MLDILLETNIDNLRESVMSSISRMVASYLYREGSLRERTRVEQSHTIVMSRDGGVLTREGVTAGPSTEQCGNCRVGHGERHGRAVRVGRVHDLGRIVRKCGGLLRPIFERG